MNRGCASSSVKDVIGITSSISHISQATSFLSTNNNSNFIPNDTHYLLRLKNTSSNIITPRSFFLSTQPTSKTSNKAPPNVFIASPF